MSAVHGIYYLVYTSRYFPDASKPMNEFCSVCQVSVIPESEYEIPEGCRVKEGSRSSQRKLEFPPRSQLRKQFEKDMEAAAAAVAT